MLHRSMGRVDEMAGVDIYKDGGHEMARDHQRPEVGKGELSTLRNRGFNRLLESGRKPEGNDWCPC